MNRYPSLYQINTRVWLNQLSQSQGRPATLDDIPDGELDHLATLGFDWLYFLTVWQTGSAGPLVSRTHPPWLKEYQALLPDLQEEDICGSGFAIVSYGLHQCLGEPESLIRLKNRLHQRGLKLMLDFVPNHTAIDHPWVQSHTDYYIDGSEEQLNEQPQNYIKLDLPQGTKILAHGRDPDLEGWPDTLQLNYGNPALQTAMVQELLNIAPTCDGLRCDVAMLLLPEIFEKTWGVSTDLFWPNAIQEVRRYHPNFMFMAEVYWDLEWILQHQGFDYTYDKGIYDRLQELQAQPVRDYFQASLEYQQKSVHFLENHDEARAALSFPTGIHQAAAILTFFCPGLRFFHQGQLQGWAQKVSVHLCRGPLQPTDPGLSEFYHRLLSVLHQDIFRSGAWQLLTVNPAGDDDKTGDCLVVFAWQGDNQDRILVVVNYAPHQSQGYVPLPWLDGNEDSFLLQDLMAPECYERSGDRLLSPGLYLDVSPWEYHVFRLK